MAGPPPYEASANLHLECVKLLLERSANPSPIFDLGKTPLDLVFSGKPHHNWSSPGSDRGQYLNGEVYRQKEEDLGDTYRREEIRELLLQNGAKTANDLYREDKSAFKHVRRMRPFEGYWSTFA